MIGERTERREDARLTSGRGRYLADHDVPGLAHVAILRSTSAHAVIRGIDVSGATALPGVIAVVTQADLDRAGARPMTHRLPLLGVLPLEWGLLARDRARFVGEPIAAVVAATRSIAEDAMELIVIDEEQLPAVVDPFVALAPGAPLLYSEWGTNEFFRMTSLPPVLGDVLATAPYVKQFRLTDHRIAALPLEGHGVQAAPDPATGTLHVYASNQQPHQLRTVIAETCGLDEQSVRVVAPDMGGGFGNKQHFTREECLTAMLALITGRPVRWIQDRTEGLISSIHSREQVHDVTVGYDDSGKVLAYRVDVTANVGNPILYFSGIGPAIVTVGALEGGYDFGVVGFDLRCVATNTCPIGAYRGFGQPQAHFSSERTLDAIAVDLGLDPIDVRRRNLLPDGPRPWITGGGARIDVGPLGPHLDALVTEFGYGRWRDLQSEARADGRLVGIGVSALVQGTAPTQYGVAGRFGSYESAAVAVLPDGRVTVAVGTKSQGQGHETTLAQVAADVFGVGVDRVTVTDGDTAQLPYGMGTWGSRTAVMAGGAVLRAATQLREKMDRIAAGMQTASAEPPTFSEIAEEAWWQTHRLPADEEPGLQQTVVYTPGNTMPVPDEHGHMNFDETFAAHMTAVAVEVDPETGDVRVLDAVLVSDCGVVINPMVVEGQHQGGFAQGLGAVLFEEVRYDDDGQPLTSTLVDYTIPEAPDVPRLRVVQRETPSAVAGGFRGVGEASIIATPAVIAGAVADALAPLGVEITSTRLHAHYLRRAIRAAGYTPDASAFASR
ncbi:MAG: aerobic carbon-monoxide dehydrogenase large subunit [Actinomycetota bacterium]|nr:aerobic carbon-monoxide dehydrogenase large subunit [Actinomycetota bacterium]